MAATDSPRARASASATARTKAGSLRFPRWGTGARYGPSVSTSRRSGGQAVRRSVIAQFLKVIMPLKEKYAAIAIPASNTPGPELNECSTTGVSAPRSIAATSSSGSRAREDGLAVGVERRIAQMAVGVDQPRHTAALERTPEPPPPPGAAGGGLSGTDPGGRSTRAPRASSPGQRFSMYIRSGAAM